MDVEYKKAAEKLLCGITDKRLHEPAIWNDILSSVRSGNLRLWEINDEILRIKYFCKEKIERASAFTESDKSGVQFDDLNEYFIKALESRDKGYFEAFIKAYEPVLQSRAERCRQLLDNLLVGAAENAQGQIPRNTGNAAAVLVKLFHRRRLHRIGQVHREAVNHF